MSFAEKIRNLRLQNNLTQTEAARAIGTTLRTYSSYENEGRFPRNRSTYEKIAAAFGCSLNDLFDDDEKFVELSRTEYGTRGNRQAEDLLKDISGLFAGGSISEDDKDILMKAIQDSYWEAKEYNKRFSPKKRR